MKKIPKRAFLLRQKLKRPKKKKQQQNLKKTSLNWQVKDLEAASKEFLEVKNLAKLREKYLRSKRHRQEITLQTNRRLVLTTFFIILLAGFVFSLFVYIRLYQQQDYSTFSYNLTRVLPLPVARVGSTFVDYQAYLKDLRRQIHYFENQQNLDFQASDLDQATTNQVELAQLKDFAIDRAINQVFVEKLANQLDLRVTQAEVNQRLQRLRQQNRLSQSSDDFKDVLNNFWGLTPEAYQEDVGAVILQEKVVKKMDQILGNQALKRLRIVQAELKAGSDFGLLARKYSEDRTTAINGGQFDFLLRKNSPQEDPLFLEAAFNTPVGGFSEIIDLGSRLEIIKVLADEGSGQRRIANIRIYYISLAAALEEIRQQEKVVLYLKDLNYSFGHPFDRID